MSDHIERTKRDLVERIAELQACLRTLQVSKKALEPFQPPSLSVGPVKENARYIRWSESSIASLPEKVTAPKKATVPPRRRQRNSGKSEALLLAERTLKEPFDAADLAKAAKHSKKADGCVLARWAVNGWITRVAVGTFTAGRTRSPAAARASGCWRRSTGEIEAKPGTPAAD